MKYNQWWTIKEMAELKGLPFNTLIKKEYRQLLPPVTKVGGVLRAHVTDVMEWRDMSDDEVIDRWHNHDVEIERGE